MASSSNEADVREDEFDELDFQRDSDEDTEDASETEAEKKEEEFTGIKDQMYRDQLHQYRKQLQQLKDGTYPPYLKKLKKLEQMHSDRLLMNDIYAKSQLEIINDEYEKEKDAAIQEFEERKQELKENLVKELEHKKKMVENERLTMELTGDNNSTKPVTTRKLRRRPNDPLPAPEKRSKPSPVQLSNALYEQDVTEDLMKLTKFKSHPSIAPPHQNFDVIHDVYIEDSRLCLDKRWFSKDQQVTFESKEHGKHQATLTNIGHDEITLKRTADGTKVKVSLLQLQRGNYLLRKRT